MADDVKIDVMNAKLPMQCMEILARVYNHPQTNRHTKDYIRFELQSLLGRETDIKSFLNDKQYKMSK